MLSNWQDVERTFRSLERQMNRSFFGSEPQSTDWLDATVTSDEAGLNVALHVPGVLEENLRVTVEDGALVVSGERTIEVPKGYRPRLREREAGKFSRSFRLSSQIDVESVVASLKEGVLTVHLPKRKELKARQVVVTAS